MHAYYIITLDRFSLSALHIWRFPELSVMRVSEQEPGFHSGLGQVAVPGCELKVGFPESLPFHVRGAEFGVSLVS